MTIQNILLPLLRGGFLLLFLSFIPSSLYSEACGSFISRWKGPLLLETGWRFRKGDNQDWKEIQVEESFWLPRNIPDYGISKTENLSGYHWYRCKLVLPDNFETPTEPLGIRLGKLRDLDETYLNGVLIGKTGNLLPQKEPDFHKDRIYPLPSNLWQAGENVISIRLYASGVQQGLKTIPKIDKEVNLIQELFSENAVPVGFGYIFILMGLYFLMGSFIRGLRRENSFFGLFSILIGLYTLIRSQYRYELFESFTSSYIFELLVLVPLPALFINFLIAHLDVRRNYLVYLNEAVLLVLFVMVPFTNTISGWNLIIKIFNYSLPLSFIIVSYYIWKNYKMNFSKLKFVLIGLMGLFPTILIDSLSAIEVISMEGTIYFGFFFFLVLISVQLSEEMLSSLQKFIALESELIRMEKIKTGFLLNISGEFKSGIEKISDTIQKLKSSQSSGHIVTPPTASKKKKAATKKTKKSIPKTQVASFRNDLENLDALVSTTISMIDEAVLLRKLDSKEYFLEYSTFDVGNLIHEIVDIVQKKADQKRRNLDIGIYPQEAIIHSDKLLLTAIIRNLVENAFHYTDPSVRIEIEFQIYSDSYSLTVSDEGIGMSIFEQENLFKKFVRGGKNDHIPGAGIGLTLCKQAALALGGDIHVKSSEGLGSVFSLKFPAVKK